MKQVNTAFIIRLSLPQFAVGLFTAMINNYLIYFYQPTAQSNLPIFITQGTILFGVLTVIGFIKAMGHIIDAISDPLIANMSDKCKHKQGRRIPFMKYSAIPFGLSALLIFCAPSSTPGLLNAVWIAIWMWAYYLFYTFYMIPHTAFLPEVIQESSQRMNAYTFGSFFFVTGSAVGYVTPLLVDLLKKAGSTPVMAWRLTFALFTIIGIVLLLVPSFSIKEKDYVKSIPPRITLKESLQHAFSNRHFRIVTLGQLLEHTGMSFFQACIMFYVTSLMGLAEVYSVPILAISIGGSLALYPVVNKWAKRKGKRIPLIWGCIVFSLAEVMICFSDQLPGNPMILACLFALFVSFPFAVLNVLPGSMMADVIQYDTIVTGTNQEGIFAAARSFIVKMGTSLTMMIVPSLTVIGATANDNVGKLGLKWTAILGGMFTILAVFAFLAYREKEVLDTIKQHATKGERT